MRARPEAALAVAAVLAWATGAALAGRVGIWLAMGSVALVTATVVAILDGARLARLARPTTAQVATGALVGFLMAGASHALHPLAVAIFPRVARDTARLYAAFSTVPWPFSAIAIAPIVAGEEIVWRGLVHDVLARRTRAVTAVGWGAMVYAAAHAPTGSVVLVAAAAGCGLCWGALRALTRGLAAPFVAHLVWDALVLFLWPLRPL